MPDSVWPQNNRAFVNKLTAMIDALNADLPAYGIPPAIMADLVAERDSLDAAITESNLAKHAYRGKITQERESRKSCDAKARIVSRLIRANLSNEDPKLIRATLRPYDRIPTTHHPITPDSLWARVKTHGEIQLGWESAGNKRNTLYVIEIKIGDSDWTYLDTTTRTRYIHRVEIQGVQIEYRVYAQRPAGRSSHSNIASVFSY